MSRIADPPRKPRSPWQLTYGAAHRLRRWFYQSRARRLPRPVISIGNLHWGGTGKTPFVAAVAKHLLDTSRGVAILSRGYGREERGVRLVSDGHGPLLGPSVAGDEPVLLAGEVLNASVFVAPDRYDAGRHAMERLEPTPDVFVLDDGFSHLKLQRDLDILTFPVADPWGGGRLWPSGRLREPLTSAARADAAVLTGPAVEDARLLGEGLREFGFTGSAFAAATRTLPARDLRGDPITPGRVLAVSAIARPEAFHRSAHSAGFTIVEKLVFPDHHAYPASSLERISDRCKVSGAEGVLTTSKDRVKLMGRLDVPIAELPLESVPEAEFWRWLDRALAMREGA